MLRISLTNQRKIVRSFAVWTLGLVVLLGIVGLAAPTKSIAAPKTSGTQKTEKQCKNDRTQCLKECDSLIDVGDNIKRCQDRCTDAYLICLPLRSGQPGSKLGGMRPSDISGKNAPIMQRGIEGEQPGEPTPNQSEETNPSSETK